MFFLKNSYRYLWLKFVMALRRKPWQDEKNYSQCAKCKEGKMESIASYPNHNGTLVNVKELNRLLTKSKASPPIKPANPTGL